MRRSARLLITITATLALTLAGCAAEPDDQGSDPATETSPASESDTGTPDATAGEDARSATVATDEGPEEGSVVGDVVSAGGLSWEVVSVAADVPREFIELDAGRALLSDQAGLVHVLQDGQPRSEPFLDLTETVVAPNDSILEYGLAGFAIAPDFAESGRFYTMTTQEPSDADRADGFAASTAVLEAWTADPGTLVADPTSGTELLRVPLGSKDHIGGEIVLDDEGMLWTSAGVPERSDAAQDPTTLRGSVLRIDPINPGEVTPYGIPQDNPFAESGGRPEIYSYGYRNPWRLSWAPEHGLLVAEALWRTKSQALHQPQPGDNAGFPEVGEACWDDDGRLQEGCRETEAGVPIAPPVVEYGSDIGQIMSGVLVVPPEAPEPLAGSVLVSDWRGALLRATPGEAPWPWERLELPAEITDQRLLWGLGTDDSGGVLVMTTETSMTGGAVYRLVSGD